MKSFMLTRIKRTYLNDYEEKQYIPVMQIFAETKKAAQAQAKKQFGCRFSGKFPQYMMDELGTDNGNNN